MDKREINLWLLSAVLGCWVLSGCTVKAVGDPNRPITINAHIILDIKGLEKTASNIEDYVSGTQTDIKAIDKKGEKS